MSDTSDDTVHSDAVNEDNICRDFLRGLCERKFCKFKHEFETKHLSFCHDFQNNVCQRLHCKFIHCTSGEVDEYKLTGQMSYQILVEATRKNQLPGNPPVCNQFKMGQCRRIVCQFRHVTKEQEEAELRDFGQNNNSHNRVPPVFLNNNVKEAQLIPLESLNGCMRRTGVSFDEYAGDGLPFLKRRLLTAQEQEFVPCEVLEASGVVAPVFKGYFAGNPPSPMLTRVDARSIMLEEENSLLHKEITRLKKQVSDLTATNEFLLDQNANLRVSGQRNGTVNVPAVTITNTNSPQQAQQVNRTVIASVATVPVSLATVSTCNPVSGNHSVSIAGCPSVSIASPGQLLANSQQILVTTNPTTQLALANSSQAHLAIAQQNLANNLAQPQLTSQAQQQLALATTTQQLTSQAQHMANQQLTSQAQHMANQQLALANRPQQLTTQSQQMALANNQQAHQQAQQLALASTNQQLTSQAQQLALATTTQQLTSQAQQLALASTNQQLTSQVQQLALATTTQQLTSQAQQLAMANSSQQLSVTSVPQQLALASTNQQLLAQQNLASELHRNNQMNAIATSQAIAMSHASQPMVSYPIMTQSINHALTH